MLKVLNNYKCYVYKYDNIWIMNKMYINDIYYIYNSIFLILFLFCVIVDGC